MSGPRLWAVLGDSLSEGVGDPMPDRSLRGWAALLAAALAVRHGTVVHNLASRGATAGSVRAGQLPVALSTAPDLASVVVGVNDIMLRRFDIDRFSADLDETVRALRAAGAQVITARLHDPGQALRVPGRPGRALRDRVAALNVAVDVVSTRYGALCLDMSNRPELRETATWSLDRLHPGERGHRLVAREVARLLREAGLADVDVPLEAPPGQAGAGRRGQLRWLATDGGPWLAGQYAARLRRRAPAGRPPAERHPVPTDPLSGDRRTNAP